MATKQIIFDSNTLSFDFLGRAGDKVKYMIDNKQNISTTKITETINMAAWIELSFTIKISEADYYTLLAWASYAAQGYTFDIAFDSTETGNELLTGSASAGQKTIEVDPTDFSTGDILLLRTDDRFTYEVVEVDSQDSDSIEVVENLKFSYAINDQLKHLSYYPNMIIEKNSDFEALRTGGLDLTNAYRKFTLKCREEKV